MSTDRREPVIVVEHDAQWPSLFRDESARLLKATRSRVTAIEHIGSTSVPGLAAKPVIDILIGVRVMEDADALVQILSALGYEYVPEFEGEIPGRRFFRKSEAGATTHHVHVVEHGGELWRRHIQFRDRLRAAPRLRDAYAQLKRSLATAHRNDREAYTESKSDFIRSALASERRM